MALTASTVGSEKVQVGNTSIEKVDLEKRPPRIVFTVKTPNTEPGMPGYVEHKVSASLFPDPLLVARRDGKILVAQEDTEHSGPFYFLTVESEHDLPGPFSLVDNTRALLYKITEANAGEGLFVQPLLYTKALHDGLKLLTPGAGFRDTNPLIERARNAEQRLRDISLGEIHYDGDNFSLGIITSIEIGEDPQL